MSKFFNKQVFFSKRPYHLGDDCIVDITSVITIFGHVFRNTRSVVMPFGYTCNSCVHNGAAGPYCVRPKEPCMICPLH